MKIFGVIEEECLGHGLQVVIALVEAVDQGGVVYRGERGGCGLWLRAVGVRDDDSVFLRKAETLVGEGEGKAPVAVVKAKDGVFLDLGLDGVGGEVRMAEFSQLNVQEEDGLAAVFFGDERRDFRAGALVGQCGLSENVAQT